MILRMLFMIMLIAPTHVAWANIDSLLVAASDTTRAFDEREVLLKAAMQKTTHWDARPTRWGHCTCCGAKGMYTRPSDG